MIASLTLTFYFISLTQVSEKGQDLHNLSIATSFIFNNPVSVWCYPSGTHFNYTWSSLDTNTISLYLS
jgi:hypothetical protein